MRYYSNNFLMHHGVKGMKWGVWNEETRAKYLNVGRLRKTPDAFGYKRKVSDKTAETQKMSKEDRDWFYDEARRNSVIEYTSAGLHFLAESPNDDLNTLMNIKVSSLLHNKYLTDQEIDKIISDAYDELLSDAVNLAIGQGGKSLLVSPSGKYMLEYLVSAGDIDTSNGTAYSRCNLYKR